MKLVTHKQNYASSNNSSNDRGNVKTLSIASAISFLCGSILFPYFLIWIPTKVNIIPTTDDLCLPEKIRIESPNNLFDIYYTTDGSSPTNNGIKYENEFEVTEDDIQNGAITITAYMRFFSFQVGEMEKKKYTISGGFNKQENTEIHSESHPVTSNSSSPDTPESSDYTGFEILEDGEIIIEENAKILLKSDQAFYLSADANSGVIFANLEKPSVENAWRVNHTSDGYTGFYSCKFEKYLTCEKDFDEKIIRFSSDTIQRWECYKLYVNGDFVIIKSQANDMYFACTIDQKDYPVRVDATVAQAWEQFSLFIYDENKMEWINPITGEYGLQ